MNYRISLFIAFALFSLIIYACGNGNREPGTSGRTIDLISEVHFLDRSMDTISTVQVAIADTENKRNLGLMDVYDLPYDAGMLFIFDDEDYRSFWMQNTPLPLDIIYINSDRRIVRIHQNTTPFSERQIPSGYPAQYVVEVNGGYTVDHDIRVGMYVDF